MLEVMATVIRAAGGMGQGIRHRARTAGIVLHGRCQCRNGVIDGRSIAVLHGLNERREVVRNRISCVSAVRILVRRRSPSPRLIAGAGRPDAALTPRSAALASRSAALRSRSAALAARSAADLSS